MEPPSLPESEPLRRSTRNCNKVEAEDKNSKYEPDSFSDPRKRIRKPELLERLNEFLWDIGTDPDQIDVNFPDLSSSSNQARVFYVPRLEEDTEQSIVLERKETEMVPEGNVQADVMTESAPLVKMEAEAEGNVQVSVMPESASLENMEVDPEGNVQADVMTESAPLVKMEAEAEGNVQVSDMPESASLENMEADPEGNVQADMKPEPLESSTPKTILAAKNDQNAVDDDIIGASTDSISLQTVEKVDSEEENERSSRKTSPGMRARNMSSNCNAI